MQNTDGCQHQSQPKQLRTYTQHFEVCWQSQRTQKGQLRKQGLIVRRTTDAKTTDACKIRQFCTILDNVVKKNQNASPSDNLIGKQQIAYPLIDNKNLAN